MDEALGDALTAARNGDGEAYRVLWRAFNPALLRYLAVRDPAHFEDLASETWLHVVRDLPRFRGTVEDFRAWLFALARHRSVDAWRAHGRRPTVVSVDAEYPTNADFTEEAALERLTTARAIALVRTLPQDQADVVALRMIADLDVHATAALLGKSAGAVRVLCHRGLKTLARRLPASQVRP